jgi:hypothetical protein
MTQIDLEERRRGGIVYSGFPRPLIRIPSAAFRGTIPSPCVTAL